MKLTEENPCISRVVPDKGPLVVASGLGEGAGEGEEGLVGQEGGPFELVLARTQVHREMEEIDVLQGVHCGRTLNKSIPPVLTNTASLFCFPHIKNNIYVKNYRCLVLMASKG
jgi:hypothetical protein